MLLSFHFQRGVVSASVSLPPNINRDEPRKRLRGKFIECPDYRDSTRANFGERAGYDAAAFSNRDDLVDGNVCQFIGLSAWPGDHQRFDRGSFAQAKMNAWIARG